MRKTTPAGFGCLIGAEEAKVRILNVLLPFRNEKGKRAGFSREAVDEDVYAGSDVPDLHQSEALSGLHWLPRTEWNQEEQGMLACERLFGIQPGSMAYAWSKVVLPGPAAQSCHLYGTTTGP